MQAHEMVESLAEMRDRLCREYQLTGHADDRDAISEAIAAVSVAEERVTRLLSPASA